MNEARAYFDWLDELARGDGVVDRWLASLLVDLQRRHQAGRTTNLNGLVKVLDRLEADLQDLASGRAGSPLIQVQEAKAALARHDAGPLRILRGEFAKAAGPIRRTIAEVLMRNGGWEDPLNSTEEDALSWSLTLIESDLQGMTPRNPKTITPEQVHAARLGLTGAGANDLKFMAILDRLAWNDSTLDPFLEIVAVTLERDSARFRAIDASGLAADLVQLEAQIKALSGGRAAVLSPDHVHAVVNALKGQDASACESLIKNLKANPSYAARALGDELTNEASGFRTGDDDGLALEVKRFPDLIAALTEVKGILAPDRVKRMIGPLKGIQEPEPADAPGKDVVASLLGHKGLNPGAPAASSPELAGADSQAQRGLATRWSGARGSVPGMATIPTRERHSLRPSSE